MLKRAYDISSDWNIFINETRRIKQTLINNGFSNLDFDNRLKHFINKKFEVPPPTDLVRQQHKIYYKNQMSQAYKTDERTLHSIIFNNVCCVQPNDQLQLVIYYKNRKTANLIMKNNPHVVSDDLRSTNVVYQYSCLLGDCGLQPTCYIGETVTTLSRRITGHLQSGAPKQHASDFHDTILTRDMMVNNTKVIYRAADPFRLKIAESLLIRKNNPVINRQDTGFVRTIRLFATRTQAPQAS
jgi:hypothetical protein